MSESLFCPLPFLPHGGQRPPREGAGQIILVYNGTGPVSLPFTPFSVTRVMEVTQPLHRSLRQAHANIPPLAC